MNNTRYIREVSLKSINEHNPMVGYTDGDIAILDNVKQLPQLNPMRASMNFIIVCCEGRIQLDVNGIRRQLVKNDVLFSCPGVVLDNYMVSPDFECKIICLSERMVQALLHEHIETWNRAVYIRRVNVISLTDDYIKLNSLYHELMTLYMQMSDRRFAKEAMQSLIRALLFELSSILTEHDEDATPGKRQSQGSLLFDRFLKMLSKEEVKRRPVGYYANQLAVTPKYLTMVCEQWGGKPAKEWINQFVVEDVRHHLRNTALPMKEVADRLGFANISHFGTYVRRHFGLSPTTYREREQTTQATRTAGQRPV